MTPQLYAIIDDRESLSPELERLIGNIYFGDLLRRRRRYVDELVAATSGADDFHVLRTDAEAEALVRQIETARGDVLWVRLPVVIAPLDMTQLEFLIRKMRYALEPMFLGPMFEDEAPVVLPGPEAITLLTATPGKARRSYLLQLAETATAPDANLEFVDLRQADVLRRFMAGATEPRAFNRMSVDRDIFTKSSTDLAKMRAEFGFFEVATPEMRRFLLPTFGFEERDGVASYKMEHLRIPDAALQFVLGTFTTAQFDQLLDQFFAFIAARDREKIGKAQVQERGQVQILKKMRDRLDTFLASPIGKRIDSYLVSGGITDGLEGLTARATPFIERALQSHNSNHLALSHGDPCLSNILFDGRIGLMRLIDPRGAVVREDGLMHPLYDLAKFSHSICGGYDFVNNGLFSVEVDDDLALELQRHKGGTPDWMRSAFRQRLEAEGWLYHEVRAVEASLFLSMLPLHTDHERKLLGFALIAQDIIEELETSHG